MLLNFKQQHRKGYVGQHIFSTVSLRIISLYFIHHPLFSEKIIAKPR